MMLPGTTISPPNFLTPSRRPRLSRPLREEPPAFLCAIRHSFLMRRTAGTCDLGDAQHGLLLAMTLFAPIVVPPLLFEDDDLWRAGLLDDGGGNRRAGQQRRPGCDLGSLADHQHLGEFDHRTGFARELLDRDHIILGDLVLFAAGPDHREHDTADMGLRAPEATAETAGGRGHPVREPCTNALSRPENTTKIVVSRPRTARRRAQKRVTSVA